MRRLGHFIVDPSGITEDNEVVIASKAHHGEQVSLISGGGGAEAVLAQNDPPTGLGSLLCKQLIMPNKVFFSSKFQLVLVYLQLFLDPFVLLSFSDAFFFATVAGDALAEELGARLGVGLVLLVVLRGRRGRYGRLQLLPGLLQVVLCHQSLK